MKTQKITAHIPSELLRAAQKVTNKGITETVKTSLEYLTNIKSFENIRKLKGKVKFSIDLNELRKDKK
jgi:hypothetical protein